MPATPTQILTEFSSITAIGHHLCAVHAVLESVVITRSGTILALWQPIPGSTEPQNIRQELKHALPGASKKQVLKDTVLLHTTLARVARSSTVFSSEQNDSEALWSAAGAITREFCGLDMVMDTMWFVEEHDMLALALNGKFKKRPVQLQCVNNN